MQLFTFQCADAGVEHIYMKRVSTLDVMVCKLLGGSTGWGGFDIFDLLGIRERIVVVEIGLRRNSAQNFPPKLASGIFGDKSLRGKMPLEPCLFKLFYS